MTTDANTPQENIARIFRNTIHSRHKMTDDRLKLWLGFAIVAMYIALAGVVAIGKVMEGTSFGLQYILGALSPVPTTFAQWAWERRRSTNSAVSTQGADAPGKVAEN